MRRVSNSQQPRRPYGGARQPYNPEPRTKPEPRNGRATSAPRMQPITPLNWSGSTTTPPTTAPAAAIHMATTGAATISAPSVIFSARSPAPPRTPAQNRTPRPRSVFGCRLLNRNPAQNAAPRTQNGNGYPAPARSTPANAQNAPQSRAAVAQQPRTRRGLQWHPERHPKPPAAPQKTQDAREAPRSPHSRGQPLF